MESILNVERVIQERKEFREKFTDYVNKLYIRSNKEKQKEFSDLRKINLDTVVESGIFYVNEPVELMIPEYISLLDQFGLIASANNKPIYSQRWVIPIRDKDNMVQALVGYTNKADERYVYSTTDFYLRGDTLYGEEQLNQAMEDGYAVLAEGITDALHIRSLGFSNIFANCGTRRGNINFLRLNRLKYGLIRIPDRDTAGDKTKRTWITDKYITLVTPPQYKDSDEVLKDERYIEVFKAYLNEAIRIMREEQFIGDLEINFI